MKLTDEEVEDFLNKFTYMEAGVGGDHESGEGIYRRIDDDTDPYILIDYFESLLSKKLSEQAAILFKQRFKWYLKKYPRMTLEDFQKNITNENVQT
jgi:hypothetical protein